MISKTLACLTMILLMAACEKDIDQTMITTGTVPELSASATTLVLDREKAAEPAVNFTWEAYQLTWSNPAAATAIVSYTLQIGKKDDQFKTLVTSKAVDNTAAAYTEAELNDALIAAKYTTGEPAALEARLLVSISANQQAYSNTVALSVTPYEDVVMYPSLFLAGTFNNWTQSTDFRVGSADNDKTYEGYVNFPTANTEFKFSSVAGWDGTNYGDGGAGKLSPDGGAGNLKVTDAGYYLLKADINKLTWTATKTTWGIIGDAAGSWDVDVPLAYDANTRLWTVTKQLTAGEWKFRANSGWDINLGASSKAGVLANGGGNIKLETAGTYLITLDLRNGGYYTYTLELQ